MTTRRAPSGRSATTTDHLMALTEAARPTRIECLAAAAALEAALHMLDDDESAQVLAHLADEWRAEADLVLPESSVDLASKLRQLADEIEAEARPAAVNAAPLDQRPDGP